MPEANPVMSEEKTIPIDDSGESVDVELENQQEEQPQVEEKQTQPEQASEEHDEYSAGVKKRINDLTKKWREEERQKEAAISFAESVKKKNDELEKKVNSLDDSYIEEVAQKADIQEVNLKRELAVAHQNQDFNKVAEVQAALADNAATKQRITLLKQKPKTEEAEAPANAPQEFSQQQQPQAPVAKAPSAKAQAWAAANPWFGKKESEDDGKDEVMTFATWGIHTNLVNEGYNTESDDYYTEINNRLSAYFPDKMGKTNSSSTTTSTRVVQPVASANNARAGGKPGRKTVKLTPSQVSIAKKLGVPLNEYAKFVKE